MIFPLCSGAQGISGKCKCNQGYHHALNLASKNHLYQYLPSLWQDKSALLPKEASNKCLTSDFFFMSMSYKNPGLKI